MKNTEAFDAGASEQAQPELTRRNFLKGVGAGLALTVFGIKTEAESRNEEERSPFDPETQKAALAFVAETMHVTLDAAIALPAIVPAEAVSDEDFNKALGFDTGGKRQNLFLPPSTIFLMRTSAMHNLVHEYVHYIQHHYKGVTDGTTDEVENEAVAIQNTFRDKVEHNTK
jgi:hypothetical protein